MEPEPEKPEYVRQCEALGAFGSWYYGYEMRCVEGEWVRSGDIWMGYVPWTVGRVRLPDFSREPGTLMAWLDRAREWAIERERNNE